MCDNMNTLIIGCGYTADFYMNNAKAHPRIPIVGAYDTSQDRLRAFCNYHKIRAFKSIRDAFTNDSLRLVLNLTPPQSHYSVTKQCLDSGRHVYSEKPLAMNINEAKELADIAKSKNVRLACAPCSLLSNPAQTLWKAIANNAIGKIRLVYANYDGGMIAPNKKPWLWKSASGAFWPADNEFETGCTYEHAGYVLTWLAAFFGPAKAVTAFSSCQIPDKGITANTMAPDFSVGCIEYDNGIVARVTCGIVAPEEKSLLIVGDKGVLSVKHLRNDSEPVFIRKYPHTGILRYLPRGFSNKKRAGVLKDHFRHAAPWKAVDFMRGPADMVAAIQEDRPHRLCAELGVHIVELMEVLQYPQRFGYRKKLTTTFPAIEPLPWD